MFSFTMAVGRALMTAIWRVEYLRRDCLRLLHNKSPLPSKRSGVRVRCGTNAAASYLPGRHRVPTPFNHLDLNDFPFFPLLLLFGYNK